MRGIERIYSGSCGVEVAALYEITYLEMGLKNRQAVYVTMFAQLYFYICMFSILNYYAFVLACVVVVLFIRVFV